MIASVDCYFFRKYNKKLYNCRHFARDVIFDATGDDIAERLTSLFTAMTDNRVRREHVRAFERLRVPSDPCLVIFQAPRVTPHMGVFLRSKVLHLSANGVEFMPLEIAMRGFKTVKFYR